MYCDQMSNFLNLSSLLFSFFFSDQTPSTLCLSLSPCFFSDPFVLLLTLPLPGSPRTVSSNLRVRMRPTLDGTSVINNTVNYDKTLEDLRSLTKQITCDHGYNVYSPNQHFRLLLNLAMLNTTHLNYFEGGQTIGWFKISYFALTLI